MTIKPFIIDCAVYPMDVLVLIGEDNEQVKKYLKKDEYQYLLDNPLVGNGRAIYYSNGKCLLQLKYYPDTYFWKGVLAHEIFHCVTHILGTVGMKHSSKTEEAYAYLIQYLTEKIYTKLKL